MITEVGTLSRRRTWKTRKLGWVALPSTDQGKEEPRGLHGKEMRFSNGKYQFNREQDQEPKGRLRVGNVQEEEGRTRLKKELYSVGCLVVGVYTAGGTNPEHRRGGDKKHSWGSIQKAIEERV